MTSGNVLSRALPAAAYGLLTALIMLPLLKPGFILTLDLVFTPRLPMPTEITNEYGFQILLHLLSLIVPGDIIERLLLVTILLGSGLGMHRFAVYLQGNSAKAHSWPIAIGPYVAGALYMINPFTYSRFMAGQYLVLLGYMLLPFFITCLLHFLRQPGWRQSVRLAAMLTLIGVISIHTLGLTIFVAGIAAVIYIWQHRGHKAQLMTFLKFGGLSALLFGLASSYWLMPLVLNKGGTAQAIGQFTAGDQQAFATIGEGFIGKLYNVLHLEGFWAEGRALYDPADHVLPGSQIVIVIIWLLVVIGAISLWRQRQWAVVVLLAGVATLATLVATLPISPWIMHVPLLGGYREAHKFVALVALAYAVFAGFGATAVIQYLHKRQWRVRMGIAAGTLVLVPLLLTPAMFWGFHGQLAPRQYPIGWYEANDFLNRDTTDFRVLVLPWHLYMYYDFAARIIASPADKFFDKPMLSSNELEFGKASPARPNPIKKHISERILPRAGQGHQLGSKLASYNIKYVMLAKEYDYLTYRYVANQTDLRLVYDSTAIQLYENRAFGRE